MTEQIELLAMVQDGRIFLTDLAKFNAALAKFPDGEVFISVRRAYAARTVMQNRYYWKALVGPIASETGMSPQDLHAALKQKFLPHSVVWHGHGEIVDAQVIGGTTRTLTVREFSDYCDAIRLWAAEFLHLDLDKPEPEGDAA